MGIELHITHLEGSLAGFLAKHHLLLRQIFANKKLYLNCGRYDHTCDTNAHRDQIRNTFLTLKTCHVIQPSGSRTSLRDQCFFCLVHISVEFCYSLGFSTTGVSGYSRDSVCFLVIVSIQTVVICFAHAFFTVLLTFVSCSVSVEPTSTTLSTLHWRSIHTLVKLFRSHEPMLILSMAFVFVSVSSFTASFFTSASVLTSLSLR